MVPLAQCDREIGTSSHQRGVLNRSKRAGLEQMLSSSPNHHPVTSRLTAVHSLTCKAHTNRRRGYPDWWYYQQTRKGRALSCAGRRNARKHACVSASKGWKQMGKRTKCKERGSPSLFHGQHGVLRQECQCQTTRVYIVVENGSCGTEHT